MRGWIGLLLLAACKTPAERAGAKPAESAQIDAPPASSAPAPVVDASAAAGPAVPKNANVLFVSVDSLRFDMPWAGYERDIAPRLTALEKKCVNYTRAYSVASHTAPSVAAMFFGKYPTELKRDGYFSTRFAKENRSITSMMSEAGIHTVSGHAHEYMRRAGWDQGFGRYDLIPGLVWYPDLDENVTAKPLAELARKQLGELELGEDQRFFAWYHFLDPHAKWLPHKEDGLSTWGSRARDLYDGEVSYADKYIGTLLDFVEQAPWGKRTVIVFTSDHGEGVGDHGQNYHGYQVWETMVHVPLFVCVPGVAPRHVDTPRSLIDIGPTILDLFGLKAPDDYRGVSLLPEVLGAEVAAREVFVDLPANNHSFAKRALIDGRYKFVYGADYKSRELYDLQEDPQEKAPIKKGELWQEWSDKLDAKIKTLEEQKPTGCAAGCMKGW